VRLLKIFNAENTPSSIFSVIFPRRLLEVLWLSFSNIPKGKSRFFLTSQCLNHRRSWTVTDSDKECKYFPVGMKCKRSAIFYNILSRIFIVKCFNKSLLFRIRSTRLWRNIPLFHWYLNKQHVSSFFSLFDKFLYTVSTVYFFNVI